jgi:pimeloyl-ACP methyl ester carboxylesterase
VKTLEKGGLAVGGLIVQSGISSAVSVVSKRTARMLPFADMFQNYKKLPSIQAKTLVVHGDMDEVVPYENGVTNANACKNLTEFVTLECGHNDMELLHLEKMLDLYRAFIHGS